MAVSLPYISRECVDTDYKLLSLQLEKTEEGAPMWTSK